MSVELLEPLLAEEEINIREPIYFGISKVNLM